MQRCPDWSNQILTHLEYRMNRGSFFLYISIQNLIFKGYIHLYPVITIQNYKVDLTGTTLA
jgi:hypothetical protein